MDGDQEQTLLSRTRSDCQRRPVLSQPDPALRPSLPAVTDATGNGAPITPSYDTTAVGRTTARQRNAGSHRNPPLDSPRSCGVWSCVCRSNSSGGHRAPDTRMSVRQSVHRRGLDEMSSLLRKTATSPSLRLRSLGTSAFVATEKSRAPRLDRSRPAQVSRSAAAHGRPLRIEGDRPGLLARRRPDTTRRAAAASPHCPRAVPQSARARECP